jgi:hypothetical protein
MTISSHKGSYKTRTSNMVTIAVILGDGDPVHDTYITGESRFCLGPEQTTTDFANIGTLLSLA